MAARILWVLAGLVTSTACAVRSDQETSDAGNGTASLQELNSALATPAVTLSIAPNIVATSPKVFVRSEATSGPPNCLYGVYASDPRYLPGGPLKEQTNNGLLLVALANNNILNSDASLGGESRTTCPDSTTYSYMGSGVGGIIPDNVKVGDTLQVTGELTPYCDSYNKQADACAAPVFPEFTVATMSDLGGNTAVAPLAVTVADIEDGSQRPTAYAGMLVQVSDAVLIAPNADSQGSVVVQAQGFDGGRVETGLWVDSLVTSFSLPETQGRLFSQITGELHFISAHWRLQPRMASDVVLGAADAG